MSQATDEIRVEAPAFPRSAGSRFLRGIGSNVIGQAISAASSLLLVPLFLRAWGPDVYGRWISLTAFSSYLTLLDLGGQNFIGNVLTEKYVRGEYEEFRRTLSEGLSLFCGIAAAGLALMAALLGLPHISAGHRILTLTPADRVVLLCTGAAFLLAIPGGVYVTTYRATGRFARGTMIGNGARLGGLVVFVALLWMRVPPYVYAAASLAIGIATTLAVWIDIRRGIPATRGVALNWSSAKCGMAHLKGSLYFWLLAISNAMNQQGVVLVLALGGSRTAVALYATHRTASGLIGYIGNLVQSPLWPELTFLHAKGRSDDLTRISLLSIRLVGMLGACAAMGLWALLPIAYPLWTGKKLELNPILLLIFLTQAVLAAGWTTSGWPLLASNQHNRLAGWALLNGCVTVALSAALAPHWGVIGVAVGSLTGDILCGAAPLPALLSRAFGMPLLSVFKSVVAPLAALVPAWGAALLLGSWTRGPAEILGLLAMSAMFLYPAGAMLSSDSSDLVWVWHKLMPAGAAK